MHKQLKLERCRLSRPLQNGSHTAGVRDRTIIRGFWSQHYWISLCRKQACLHLNWKLQGDRILWATRGPRAPKIRAWSARNPPALMTVHRYTLDVKFVCERLSVKSLACTCICCCSIAVPLPESSGPRIEHCCFQESPHYNVLALYMSNSECACVSCVSQCMYVALIPHDPLPPAH